jgi:hypothetical protein
MNLFDDTEAQRIAADLAAKYGREALAFVTRRANRAAEIGDDIAFAIWNEVLGAARDRLAGGTDFFHDRAGVDGSPLAT